MYRVILKHQKNNNHMKILFTGGGSGGHFYPIIAIAEEINRLVKDEKLLPANLYFMSDSPYDAHALAENNIKFVSNPSGKVRRYFSILNFFDLFKTAYGMVVSLFKVFGIFPDVVFSKGAYASFPVVMAARILGIPVMIHESDSVPGRANVWAGKFAKRIAVSYPEAANYFKRKDVVAHTGNPLRREIRLIGENKNANEYLSLDQFVPTILVLGGSLGSEIINDAILEVLPQLVQKFQIIHQTGKNNITEVKQTANVVLQNNPLANRYRAFDYLNNLSLSMAASVSKLVITRAGSTIFEIANWGVPSIVIPITNSAGDHQRHNAYAYARSGAATVIEESNLSGAVLMQEIHRIFDQPEALNKMSESAKSFSNPDAAEKIAREVLRIGLSHEK